MKKVSLALVALLILSALMAGCSGGDVITDEALRKEFRIEYSTVYWRMHLEAESRH